MSDVHSLNAGKGVFLEEAAEILEQLEQSLLELEDEPDNHELVGTIFRALHTIKGSGAMFGFDHISSFTHEVETVFDQVRSGSMSASRELIDLTLESRDIIRQMIDAEGEGVTVAPEKTQAVVAALQRISCADVSCGETTSATADEQHGQDTAKEPATWRIRFKPPENILSNGSDPLFLLEDLQELGECDIIAMTEDIPRLQDMESPEQLHIGWDILLTTDRGREAIEDVFIFVGEESDLTIEVVEHHHIADNEDVQEKLLRLGDILVMRGELSREQLNAAVADRKLLGEILVEKGLLSEAKVDAALHEQKHLKKTRSRLHDKRKGAKDSSVRVPSVKLDELVNLVGELVTVQARLTQIANSENHSQLLVVAEEVERLSSELRDNTMNIRMVPIGSTFSKFRRLVRDLAKELGREVVLTTTGAETELDKTVIEKLNDPMIHLIRNALDHGVEPPEKRQAAGKAPQGSIHLEAEHSGAHVLIRIKDDGGGIDKDKLRRRAVERELMSEGAEIADSELYDFIFSPGFSTATVVSSISGRGVGMDVVRTNIEELRGSVDVDSTVGEGTTVTLKIPLTLAIIEGLLTRIGDEHYIIPLAAVEECVELNTCRTKDSGDRNLANIRGELIPYVHLRHHFSIQGHRPEIEQIVVTHVEGQRIGFVVDTVIGQHQTVIKNLGSMYQDIKEISGATILGNGALALILDISCLIKRIEEIQEQQFESAL